MKQIAQTDASFDHVAQANQRADATPKALRRSIDTKAKVKVGKLSRHGKDRRRAPRKVDAHDTEWQSLLVPFGILNLDHDELSIYCGQSAETSDFIVDCLAWWWQDNQVDDAEMEEWVINLDRGSATRSDRTQFIKRMVALAQRIDRPIRRIYYPPYHSKYHAIERCWAALEHYWHGAILDSVAAAVQWAAKMSWNASAPVVYLVDGIYEKGIKVLAEELESYLPFWPQSDTLPKWDITILPN